MTATTRRMVYATIANAVLAGLPEPQSQEFGPNEVVRLTFDSHAAAAEWGRWLGPGCLLDYTFDALDTGRSLRCYHGQRSDWSWQIVGREPLPDFESKVWACPEGCGYHIADGPVPDGEDPTDELIRQHMEDHADRSTVEQVTIADAVLEMLAPDSLRVPCGRCGHEHRRHEEAVLMHDGTRYVVCVDCPDGRCFPVVLSKQTVAGAARAVLGDGEVE